MQKPKNEICSSDCDGQCETCPADSACDHVMLTRSQKNAVMICGYWFVAMAIALAAFAVKAMVERLP